MSKYVYNENYFEVIDSPEKAYWLGFLYADGSITQFYRKERLKSMSLELTLQRNDEAHLIKFLKHLDSNVPIQSRIIKKKYYASRIVINCTKMCRDLILLGCTPRKSLTLTFPTEAVLKEIYYKSFIRGYFDGDGGIHYGESLFHNKKREKLYLQYSYECYFSGTTQFLSVVKNLLYKNSITSSKIYSDNRSNAKSIYIYGKDNIKKFEKYLYENSTVHLSRKFNKFNFITSNKYLKINTG